MSVHVRRFPIADWSSQGVVCLVVAGGYVAFGLLGFYAGTVHQVLESVWPAAGLSLGVLLCFGLRLWPGVFLGALGNLALQEVPAVAALSIAGGNTLAAAWGAYALQQARFQLDLHRVRDSLMLVGLGAFCSPLISSSIGALSMHLGAGIPDANLPALWIEWWRGDAMGIMLVVPLLLAWMKGGKPELTPGRALEAAILGGTLLVAGLLVLRAPQGFEYAVFPLVSWGAIRFGSRGASTAVTILAGLAVWYTINGGGPFVEAEPEGLWRLQLFLALLTVASLVLTSMAQAQATVASALKNTELRFRRIFEHSAVGIAVIHPGGGLTEANPAFRKMLGYSSDELACRSVADITHPEDMAAERVMLDEILAARRTTYRMVKRYLRKDGSVFWGRLTATHVPEGEDGQGSAGVGMIEDISEQRAAEEALQRESDERRESAEKLRRMTQTLQTLIDASPLAIMTLDAEGRVRSWNRAAEGMFGWSAAEAVGQVLPFVPPDRVKQFRESLSRVFSGEAITGLQRERCCRDGKRIDVRVCAAPTRDPHGVIDGVIALVEDVTERKNLGEQLRQAQKMEAIGQLTGGIAHDFNNILTIVITNASLLANEIGTDRPDIRADLSDLKRAALRGVELVRKLMVFSRRRSVEMQPLNLGQAISDASNDLRRLLPASMEVAVQVETGVPVTIIGDVGAIEQMLFNLATNARDAMTDRGTIRLAVYRSWLDEEHCRTRGWGAPGEYVVVAVGDTGCGMSPSVRARAFEPFFTTKEVGKGTGLGMAMVYGLVSQHKGFIDLHSEEGRGTTVRLYFPAVAASVLTAQPVEDLIPVGGTERILVVDDEEGIRRSAARVLSRYGYEVDEASDGVAAMNALRGARSPFNLVLTDVVMPRMGGMALYQALRKDGSAVRVLLMSGHTAEDLDQLDDPVSGAKFLHKPWSMTDLLRRVREVLDDKAGAAA